MLGALVDNALEAILVFDFSGTVLFANHATAVLIEVDNPHALTGRKALEFIPTEQRHAVLADFVSVREGRDAYLAHTKLLPQPVAVRVESIGKKIQFGVFRQTSLCSVTLRIAIGRRTR